MGFAPSRTPIIRVLLLAMGWLLSEIIVIVGVLSLYRFAWSRRILAGDWSALGLVVVATLLVGVVLAILSIRTLVGPIREMRRVPRTVWLLTGALLALVSVYALAWGIGETEWSMSGDSCISRSDQPPDARGYRVAPSSSPPWGVVCTYDLEGGRTITLPQWYPQRGLPYVAGTVGLSLLYLVSLATLGKRTAPT
jgi:hypothetical protein